MNHYPSRTIFSNLSPKKRKSRSDLGCGAAMMAPRSKATGFPSNSKLPLDHAFTLHPSLISVRSSLEVNCSTSACMPLLGRKTCPSANIRKVNWNWAAGVWSAPSKKIPEKKGARKPVMKFSEKPHCSKNIAVLLCAQGPKLCWDDGWFWGGVKWPFWMSSAWQPWSLKTSRKTFIRSDQLPIPLANVAGSQPQALRGSQL